MNGSDKIIVLNFSKSGIKMNQNAKHSIELHIHSCNSNNVKHFRDNVTFAKLLSIFCFIEFQFYDSMLFKGKLASLEYFMKKMEIIIILPIASRNINCGYLLIRLMMNKQLTSDPQTIGKDERKV